MQGGGLEAIPLDRLDGLRIEVRVVGPHHMDVLREPVRIDDEADVHDRVDRLLGLEDGLGKLGLYHVERHRWKYAVAHLVHVTVRARLRRVL